jgi:hypothetical protein
MIVALAVVAAGILCVVYAALILASRTDDDFAEHVAQALEQAHECGPACATWTLAELSRVRGAAPRDVVR